MTTDAAGGTQAAGRLKGMLLRLWPISMAGALGGFLCTILITRAYGAAAFADYGVTLAKLSLILLTLELIPNGYAVFRQQRDEGFRDALPSAFLLFMPMIATLAGAAALAGWLDISSPFIWLYLTGATAQRYFDVRLQAQGAARSYYALVARSAWIRLALMAAAVSLAPALGATEVIWGALGLGLWASLLWAFVETPQELSALRRAPRAGLRPLWAERGEIIGYYPATIMKRLKDVCLPLLADALIADRAEIGRYLLAWRGIEFVCGQLRAVEVLLSNFGLRAALSEGRGKALTLLALLGQLAAAAASLFLAAQAGFSLDTVLLALIGSMFIYPYVLEMTWRADAYAASAPRRVALGFLAFILGILAVSLPAWALGALDARALIAAQVAGQALAALTHLILRRQVA